jgi:hypothetical protein
MRSKIQQQLKYNIPSGHSSPGSASLQSSTQATPLKKWQPITDEQTLKLRIKKF